VVSGLTTVTGQLVRQRLTPAMTRRPQARLLSTSGQPSCAQSAWEAHGETGCDHRRRGAKTVNRLRCSGGKDSAGTSARGAREAARRAKDRHRFRGAPAGADGDSASSMRRWTSGSARERLSDEHPRCRQMAPGTERPTPWPTDERGRAANLREQHADAGKVRERAGGAAAAVAQAAKESPVTSAGWPTPENSPMSRPGGGVPGLALRGVWPPGASQDGRRTGRKAAGTRRKAGTALRRRRGRARCTGRGVRRSGRCTRRCSRMTGASRDELHRPACGSQAREGPPPAPPESRACREQRCARPIGARPRVRGRGFARRSTRPRGWENTTVLRSGRRRNRAAGASRGRRGLSDVMQAVAR